MSKKIAWLVVLVLFLHPFGSGFCQNLEFKGLVIDKESRQPISDVNIYVVGSNNGTTTNDDGQFTIKVKHVPASIIVSHVGYVISQNALQDSSKSILVELKKEEIDIDEITVFGQRVLEVSNKDSVYLIDYLVQDNNQIVAYGVINKNPNQERLMLLSNSGNILYSTKVEKVGLSFLPEGERNNANRHYLFRDCYGQTHFFAKNKVWQLYIRNDSISFLYPENYNEFFSILFPVKVRTRSNVFYNLPASPLIIDSQEITRRKARSQIKLTWIKPQTQANRSAKSPVFNHNDSIIVFNFQGSKIEFYNSSGRYSKSTSFDFHLKTYYDLFLFKDRGISLNCKQIVFQDREKEKYYALFKESAMFYLYDIDIYSGKVLRTIKIPDYPNVKNIQIHGGVIYFLYTDKRYPNNQILYRYVPKLKAI